MTVIPDASIDRVHAVLLEVAEDDAASNEARVNAASSILGAAATLNPFEDPGDTEALGDMLVTAFRLGATWGREHPRGGLPGERRILEQVADATPG